MSAEIFIWLLLLLIMFIRVVPSDQSGMVANLLSMSEGPYYDYLVAGAEGNLKASRRGREPEGKFSAHGCV